MSRILVTDGEQRSTLAVVRSLGRAGHHVTVCASRPRPLAAASRFAAGSEVVPDPSVSPAGFARRLEHLCRALETDVLIPMTDASIEAILPLRDRLTPTRIPLPPHEIYRAISDKRGLMARARELGVPTPAELEVPDIDFAIDDLALPEFPVVVKPARSVVSDGTTQIHTSVAHAENRDALARALARYSAGAYPLLIQQYIPGIGEGAFYLTWNGEVVASFSHRRIREKPPAAGVSVYRESIALAPDMDDFSRRLLDDFGWTGVAMVEYRRSLSDGRPYLMEVNGRFWGSLQLAVDSGVDFPSRLVDCVVRDGDASPAAGRTPDYRTGIRSRWWFGDLDHLLIRIKETTPRYRLPPDAGSRAGALFRFMIPWKPGDRSEVFRFSDPGPGLREAVEWVRNVLASRRRSPSGPKEGDR